MDLFENLMIAKTLKEKAAIVWNHYESRKLNSSLEPNWIHVAYEEVKKFIDGDKDADEQFVQEIVHSHALRDGISVSAFPGVPSSPMRIIHDGWKSGTPTWIFMGRSFPEAVQDIGNGWVAVSRSLPPEVYKLIDPKTAPATLWIAYHRDLQMGLSALTANCVGPAMSFDELLIGVESFNA